MPRIDERTSVPLLWLLTSVLAAISVSATGCFWVFKVDSRLERIEKRLGILQPESAQIPFIGAAQAGTPGHN